MFKQRTASSLVLSYFVAQATFTILVIFVAVIAVVRSADRSGGREMPYIGSLFDLAGLLAAAGVITHLILQLWFSWRWRWIRTLTMIVLYVTSYSVLSYQGGYHAARSGVHRWDSTGLSVVDQSLWHARGIFWQRFVQLDGRPTHQATFLGYFFSPLICVDRAYIHRTTPIFEP